MVEEYQFVARDFMELGNVGDIQEGGNSKYCATELKPHGAEFGHWRGASVSLNKGSTLNSMDFAGSNYSLWSSSTSFQHLLSLGDLPQEKLMEQTAENVPERSYSTHHRQMQVVGGIGGLLKNTPSLAAPNFQTLAGFSEAAQRMPAAESMEKKDTAPLTIFYQGAVNLFNDITAERAQAIMLLASISDLKALSIADGANASALNFAMTSPSRQSPAVDKASPANLHNITTINVPAGIQMDQGKNSLNIENGQTTLNQPGLGNANMKLDSQHPCVSIPSQTHEQPVVPTALPQARKASLTRFLEKRRERIHSKSPYPWRQVDSSLPEERFSSSNDITPYILCNDTNEKQKMFSPRWMERPQEYSSDMIPKEDTRIVSV